MERSARIDAAEGDPSRRIAVLDAAACLTVRWPAGRCAACAEACPVEAIAVGERSVAIDPRRCDGCGACSAACPTAALATPIDDLLRPATLILECARVPERHRVAAATVVPCLGALGTDHLVARAEIAAGTTLVVDRGWCADCRRGGTAEPWSGAVEALTALLGVLGQSRGHAFEVATRPLPRGEALPARTDVEEKERPSRRALFTRLIRPAPTPIVAEGRALRPARLATARLSDRAERLHRLAGGAELPARLFPSVTVAETCCGNATCARVCPTGALESRHTSEVDRLDLDPTLCIGCGACAAACPTGSVAVTAEGEGAIDGRIELRRRPLTVCVRCDATFVPEGSEAVCGACRKDETLASFAHALVRRRPTADARDRDAARDGGTRAEERHPR